jgi:phosphatidylglycerol lysyltransferase
LFIGALWLLHHELKYYHLRDIQRSLAEIPAHRVWLVVALTVVNYLILIGYDLLAVRSIHHPLPLRRIALASFTGFVTSYNFGALLGGTSVRYRLYSAWGLSAVDILRLVFMLGVTFWFGVTALAGLLLFLDPFPLPASLAVLGTGVRPLGAILLFVTAAYLYLTIRLSRPIHIRGVELRLPGPGISALQIVVAAADLAVAAAALYVLLPEGFGKGFFEFLGMYLLAVVVVIFSHVPGGVGVFELMVLKLAGAEANESVVAALLVFRGVYYLLPLLAASLLLAGRELLEHRAGFQRLLGASGRAVSVVAPSLVACATFASGAILLLSGAIPPPRGRLALLEPFVPLPLVEISHFLGSVTGAALLVLAHGLQRRLDAAWWFATGLLSAAIVFSLLAGWHYEVAVALAVVLVMLAVSRRRFYRKSSLLHPGLTPGWITAIVMVVLCSIWLGLFTYRHVDYSADLWWKFAFHGHAPRFLRAMAGVVAFLLILALNRLLTRPAAPSERPTVLDLEAAARIVSVSPRAEANLALLGDKSLLFNGDRTAFVMYSVRGRSWIAFGDPIGAEPDREELAWQFRELVDRYDGWSVFYQVCETNLAVYLDLGLTLLQLGEEGRVPLEQFSLEGSARAGLRYTHHRFQRDGWTFDVVAHDAMSAILRDVKAISDAWLAEKASREQGFSLGFFNEAYLRHFPCAVVRYAGKLIAFANIWQGAEREELSIDLMRYRPGAPSGVMEFLFVELMLWGKAQGYRWFSLGMAPLSGIEDGPLAPLWNKVVGLAFRHGEHFDSGLGLREYKQKFDPVWTPRYLASPGGLVLPQILADIAVLINRPGESTVNAKVAVPAREEP